MQSRPAPLRAQAAASLLWRMGRVAFLVADQGAVTGGLRIPNLRKVIYAGLSSQAKGMMFT